MNNQIIKPRSPFRILGEYSSHIRAFKPNARLYLLNVILTGAVMGVFRLIFNFYALSLGFDEALLVGPCPGRLGRGVGALVPTRST